MFERLWVRIQAMYTTWTFFTLICCKNCIVCLKRLKINKKEAGLANFFLKSYLSCDLKYLGRHSTFLWFKFNEKRTRSYSLTTSSSLALKSQYVWPSLAAFDFRKARMFLATSRITPGENLQSLLNLGSSSVLINSYYDFEWEFVVIKTMLWSN